MSGRPPVPFGGLDDDYAEAMSAVDARDALILDPLLADAPLSQMDGDEPPLIGNHPAEFLCGTAGTGKTYQARRAAEQIDGCELTATTGIAAVNLGEGTTIHSLLRYYDTESLRDMYQNGFVQSRLRMLQRAGLRRILLDEVSMLDAHQLTMIARAIDEVNTGKTLADSDDDSPDNKRELDEDERIGLTLIGDFAQLPPVKAPFAFESKEWDRFAEHTVKLTKIHRQTDRDFVEALHAVRRADLVKALEWFTPEKFSPTSDSHFAGTTVFAKNDTVDRFNQLRLDELTSSEMAFEKSTWGKESPEWKKIPQRLVVKDQALVMVLANRRRSGVDADRDAPGTTKTGEMIYANGDLGQIVGRDDDGAVLVRLARNGIVVPVISVTRELLEPMEPGRRKELKELRQEAKIKDKREIVGAVTYMPLRLAWGTTVHKSQGLSLDNVQIDLRDRFFSAPGMIFVALSRARTPQGLRLVGSQKTFAGCVTVNPLVKPWL